MLAALAAGVAGLPGLWLPLFSSDWVHLWGAAQGMIVRTPFGNFRPLCSLTFWVDWQLWGTMAAPYHLINLIFVVATAPLVVVLVTRYTGSRSLAATTGLLFALYPYHSANVAWIAARHDPVSAVLMLGAALSYDRWRDRLRGLPVVALVLYEAAMLAKESAVVLPGLLLVIGLFSRYRRPALGEVIRGYLPLVGLAFIHFVVLRRIALGGLSLWHLESIGAWYRNLPAFAVSAVVPVQTEFIEARPIFWGLLALGIVGGLVGIALARTRTVPAAIWPLPLAFVALLGPSLISFQQRYMFLPAAAAALALAALFRSAGRYIGMTAAVLLVAGWTVSVAELWTGWYVAGRASDRLMKGLVEASLQPGVQEIVVAAVPHRVHGAPTISDFSRAVPLAGGAEVPIRTAGEFDYPTDLSDALPRPAGSAVDHGAEFVELRLRVAPGLYSRYAWPPFPDGQDVIREDWATIFREDQNAVRVRIPSGPGRRAYAWVGGKLHPLF